MDAARYHAIVIGSGIGGLTAAAALAKHGRRVLVLEQHTQLGGLTQTFRRRDYRFAVGVHYIGGVGGEPGPAGEFGRLLEWLSDGRMAFAPIGSPYDLIRLPGLELPVEAPRARYIERLKEEFPRHHVAIDSFFAACDDARRASRTLFASCGVPSGIAALLRFANSRRIDRAVSQTVADAVREVGERRLASVLSARWADYGMPPERAPLMVHAAVLGSYEDGAYYPVGGPGIFAAALGDTVRAAGGELRTGATVMRILVENGRAAGVELEGGETVRAGLVISDIGAHRTALALPTGVAGAWRERVGSLEPGLSFVTLYIGLRGDIRAGGASAANLWIYETDDVGKLWQHPADEDAPGLFVSFPSLKDRAHDAPLVHTAEVLACCSWKSFERWQQSVPRNRPEEYEALKAWIGAALLAQFKRHFPRLAPMVDFHEVSTPLSQAYFDGAEHGAAYGLELNARRLRAPAPRVRTPVAGLLLAGQDAVSMGLHGAAMGGFLAAAAADLRLWRELRAAA